MNLKRIKTFMLVVDHRSFSTVADILEVSQPAVSKQIKTLEEELFSILADAEPFNEELLPDTGVGKELERTLSSLFIASTNYGTRSSTVILIDQEGRVSFRERTFHSGNYSNWEEVAYTFRS